MEINHNYLQLKKNHQVFYALMIGTLICGFFWEFWNYWTPAKWYYDVPILGFFTIFEMPILGYLGYFPFAFELYVMYWFIRSLFSHKEVLLVKERPKRDESMPIPETSGGNSPENQTRFVSKLVNGLIKSSRLFNT